MEQPRPLVFHLLRRCGSQVGNNIVINYCWPSKVRMQLTHQNRRGGKRGIIPFSGHHSPAACHPCLGCVPILDYHAVRGNIKALKMCMLDLMVVNECMNEPKNWLFPHPSLVEYRQYSASALADAPILSSTASSKNARSPSSVTGLLSSHICNFASFH